MQEPVNTGTDVRDEVLREQVRLACSQLPTMQASSIVVALVLAFAVRANVPHVEIMIWLLLVLAVAAARTFFYRRFLAVNEGPFDGRHWERVFLALSLVSGTAWGVSAFIIFPAGNLTFMSLFILVIASLSAATTISHSSLRWGAASWAVPAMLFYAVRCFMDGGEVENIVGFLILLYLFTILNYSFKHNRTIRSSISLKFENVELLAELQKANDILRRHSSIDGLTGLTNRRSFDERLDREWRRAAREQEPVSLIMLDIDHFKPFNDNYGHQAGDACLKKIAGVIADAAKRPADIAARYGGEEFMIVLPDTDGDGAVDIAEKLRIAVELLGVPHAHSSAANVVTVSVGVASFRPPHETGPSQIIRMVDTALYAAKRAGRNRVKIAREDDAR